MYLLWTVNSWQMSIVMYHSADSLPVTAEAIINLCVDELPRYVYRSNSECFMLWVMSISSLILRCTLFFALHFLICLFVTFEAVMIWWQWKNWQKHNMWENAGNFSICCAVIPILLWMLLRGESLVVVVGWILVMLLDRLKCHVTWRSFWVKVIRRLEGRPHLPKHILFLHSHILDFGLGPSSRYTARPDLVRCQR